MSAGNFDAARFKLLRGKRHINELRFETQRLRDPSSPPKETPFERKAFLQHWHETMNDAELLALILGDAVHNLRSALDHMAVDLVVLNGKSPKRVYFPFANSESELDKQIKDKNFDRTSPTAIAELKKLQPYKGGNRLLRGLHDLDVMDKHQLILPTIHGHDPCFISGEFPIGAWDDDKCPQCETILRRSGKAEEQVVWAGRLRFGDGGPFPREEVFPTLYCSAQMVEDIIDRFARLLLP